MKSYEMVCATAVLVCSTTPLLATTNLTDQATDDPGPGAGQAPSKAALQAPAPAAEPSWNFHGQNTDIIQYHPGLTSPYSGPNSLSSASEVKQTVSLDLLFGLRLWPGAEFHADGLMWQGFGFSDAHGIEAFPNGEAFRLGTEVPNGAITRLFLRQTIGLGGEQEAVEDDALQLAGLRDISRVTLTVGRLSAKDIFDNNSYANDPRTQFMSWAFMANQAWDYPGDSLGYITGFAAELNQPSWALRYGFFQMPSEANGLTTEDRILKWPYDSSAQSGPFLQAWGMVTEFERRYDLNNHPGTARLLAFVNRANMGSYQAAVDSPIRPADIVATRDYRYKYGFGLNVEQEVVKNVGVFSRLGWSDGQNEAWVFSDVDRTATLGLSVKGEPWHRPNDTYGLAGALNGITKVHQDFFAAGGLGILAGDGALTYGWEQTLETYYDFQVWKTAHVTLDYQFIDHPAFNRDRGPVSVFAARLHWSF
jgi:high affinity Mn2+ porin